MVACCIQRPCRQKLELQEAELAAAAAARAAAEEQLHAQQAPYHKARTEARKVRGVCEVVLQPGCCICVGETHWVWVWVGMCVLARV